MLRKPKYPVLSQPNEVYRSVPVHEEDEIELIKNGTEEPFTNQFNPVKSNDLEEEHNKSVAIKSSAMERIFTFGDDFISTVRTAKIAEGIYDFRIDDIGVKENVDTQYGMKDQYVIKFSLYSEKTERIMALTVFYNISSHQKSELMMFLSAFKEVFKGQRITMNYLIGKTGHAKIYHVFSEAGNAFEKIEILNVENPNT